MSRVAVIMTHYNNSPYLPEAVRSILNQSYNDYIFIIVDDCSTDPAWLSSIEKYACHPKLHIYRSDRNVGTYRLKNKILEKIDAEMFVFHDSDDISDPCRIKMQVDWLDDNRNVWLLGTGYQEIGLDGKSTDILMPEFPKNKFDEGERYLSLHPTWCMRRELFSRLKSFDGHTRIAGDDEFLFRAIHCAEVRNLQKILYYKRRHDTSLTESIDTGFSSKLRLDYTKMLYEKADSFKFGFDDSTLVGRANDIRFTLNRII